MRADVVQAVEQVFGGSRGAVLDVDEIAMQGAARAEHHTNLDLGRRSISGFAVM